MMNNASDPTPLYAQVEAVLSASINDGSLPPGTQLPAEDGLIDRFKVSRTTIRKAIQNLIDRGLVEVRRGKGTFVVQRKLTQELTQLTGFVEDMRAIGKTPTARLIEQQIVLATEVVAHRLAVPTGTHVMRIRRVRLADGTPMSFDETYLPRDIGEKIVTHDLDAEPIFSLLEEKYDLPLIEATYELEAVIADALVAQALAVPEGSPIFLIERTSYTKGQRPIDYERLYYRGDLIRFSTRLSRSPHTAS